MKLLQFNKVKKDFMAKIKYTFGNVGCNAQNEQQKHAFC